MKKFWIIVGLVLVITNIGLTKEKDEWLGIFTTDQYPVHNCIIVKAGSILTISEVYNSPERAGSHKKNLSRKIKSNISLAARFLLEETVKLEEGFNAIVGFRINTDVIYNSFGASEVNGIIGIGRHVATAYGTPVKIKCQIGD